MVDGAHELTISLLTREALVTQRPEQWSEALQEQTRRALGELAFVPDSNDIALKHIDGRFGIIALDDLLGGRIKITDRETDAETTFANVDDLIAAGWALD